MKKIYIVVKKSECSASEGETDQNWTEIIRAFHNEEDANKLVDELEQTDEDYLNNDEDDYEVPTISFYVKETTVE